MFLKPLVPDPAGVDQDDREGLAGETKAFRGLSDGPAGMVDRSAITALREMLMEQPLLVSACLCAESSKFICMAAVAIAVSKK